MNGRVVWRCFQLTVENRTDEDSGEIGLLPKVQIEWDLRSVRVIGPGLFVGHGSDVDEGGISAKGEIELGEGDTGMEKDHGEKGL